MNFVRFIYYIVKMAANIQIYVHAIELTSWFSCFPLPTAAGTLQCVPVFAGEGASTGLHIPSGAL